MKNELVLQRWKTREISIGSLGLGGKNPIRVQSMTNTQTLDTISTVNQCIRLIEAGCELIRITTPTIQESENLKIIKQELKAAGFEIPLIADVHYNRKVAEHAARIVEKVRINPGNYIDSKSPKKIAYTENEYLLELEKIEENLYPLLSICKEYGTAIRVGSNHGSLSDRILNRYGDTAEGMANSAMEFLRICQHQHFHNVVVSMKSSQIQMVVYSTRLLVEKMMAEGMNYPVHLGVTEAGDAEDGRIKSAAGIGTLLSDGIGDTIRVSLTEAPENEIPVAKQLVKAYNSSNPVFFDSFSEKLSTQYEKYPTTGIDMLGGSKKPIVIGNISEIKTDSILKADLIFDPTPQSNVISENKIVEFSKWTPSSLNFPLFYLKEWITAENIPSGLHFVLISEIEEDRLKDASILEQFIMNPHAAIVLEADGSNFSRFFRNAIQTLTSQRIHTPIVYKIEQKGKDNEGFMLELSAAISSLLIKGFGDGIWLSGGGNMDCVSLAFNILQTNHLRFSKTEFIACPSCGRTQYNITEVLSQVKKGTEHLTGLKIGVMGCIVNGPGEMADADYGVVGSQKGKVNVYKGKEVIQKNIPEEDALDALITLIKINGDWSPR